jgi:FkbH-like protein
VTLSVRNLGLSAVMAAMKAPFDGAKSRAIVLRQSTMEPIEPYLKLAARDLGIDLELVFGAFDNMVQDCFDDRIWEDGAAWVIICPTLSSLAPELENLSEHIACDDPLFDELAARARQVIGAVRQRSDAKILWLGLTIGVEPTIRIVGPNAKALGSVAAVAHLNSVIAETIRETGAGSVVDVESCVRRVGAEQFFDPIRKYQTAVLATPIGFRSIAIELTKHMRALSGKLRKVLVLDCDNTLWDGLCGEVYARDLNPDPYSFPGGAFIELQKLAKRLKQRGVLLALASKNEPSSVWAVFENCPNLALAKDDFAGWKINWRPKSDNLKELAADLGLGIDSLVFVDDNPAEIEEVRQNAPEVACLLLDEEALANFPQMISDAGWFEALEITAADRVRTDHYIADRERKSLKSQSVDLTTYLKSLEMVATVKVDAEIDMPRAAQMCQRTNQFNLTTRRYDIAEIEKFVRDSNARVLTFELADKFGNLGDVGLTIVRHDGEVASLDTMALSCRAFGRSMEDLMMAASVSVARAFNVSALHGTYIPTGRNRIVEAFLGRSGFLIEDNDDGAQLGVLELAASANAVPKHLKIVSELNI